MSPIRKFIIKSLGGYSDFEEALAHLKKSNDVAQKNALLTEAVKKLFNTIGPDDILRMNERGEWSFMGKPMTPADVQGLKEEAAILRGMRLWRVLKIDIRYHLNKKMYEESRITEDLLWGKLITWYDDVIRTRLQQLK